MGIAVAVLDELRLRRCLFLATTHYPEIKEYAAASPGLTNARMAFDRESLMPLYRLELGSAGESCALFIAEGLGMPRRMIERARAAAYGASAPRAIPPAPEPAQSVPPRAAPKLEQRREQPPKTQTRRLSFQIGDSVTVYPQKEIGIVCARANDRGEIGVQVKGVKKLIGHKRLRLLVPASELYPDDYDFSIVFDSVEHRKARHLMGKRHVPGNRIVLEPGEEEPCR
jgi:dsDNA-specific endonuclease/ATPase MutS2